MLIHSTVELDQPVEKVWEFFQDVPQVAACMPGAELTEDLGNDSYKGNVAIRLGPIKVQYAGTAEIRERDHAGKRLVVYAAGAEQRGQGNAAMLVTARLLPSGAGTRVEVEEDLQLSGAVAQFGRGMITDVNAVLVRDFSTNLQRRIDARAKGLSPDEVGAARSASGFAIAMRAARMALVRVWRRFFAPYQPTPR